MAELERLVKFIDISNGIARKAGNLKVTRPSLRTPDAIHLATALESKAGMFITNDLPLAKVASRFLTVKTLS